MAIIKEGRRKLLKNIKLSKIMKKGLLVVCICCLSLNSINLGKTISNPAIITQASTKKATKKAAKKKAAMKAYRKMLKKGVSPSGIEFPHGTKFLLKDVNKDGIPELIVDTDFNSYLAAVDMVYTYYNGKIKEVAISDHGKTGIYQKGNVLMKCSGNIGRYTFSVYKIVKGKAKVLAVEKMDTAKPNSDYYIGGKKTTEKKYLAYVKKLTKGSKLISEKSKSWHALTLKNIDSYCS